MVARIKQRHGSGVEALTYLGQNYLVADVSIISELLQTLRDEELFDYCVDVTAVHYPEREKQFDVIWILYSFAANQRIRVKTSIADGRACPVPSTFGRRRTGWNAKSMTCSGFDSMGIPT